MKVLELFAGSRSIGIAAEQMGMDVFSSDINDFDGIDYQIDILQFDVSKVPFIPDIIWASPPCTFFSVASIGKHWHKNNTAKSAEAIHGVNIVRKTIEIINHFFTLNKSVKWYVENPRGKLRKLDCIKGDHDRTTITYCTYGDDRMKPTDIWSNNIYNPMFNVNGWKPRQRCVQNNRHCHHQAAPRGSKTGTQGLVDAYERSKIPNELCIEILKSSI